MPRVRSVSILGAILLVVVLGGCSSDQHDPVGPYAADIRYARDHATSELEKSALKDGAISRVEYQAAVDAYVQCQADQGSPVELVDSASGIYNYRYDVSGLNDAGVFDDKLAESRQAEWEKIADACSTGTVTLIAPLYGGQVTNPERLPFAQNMAECLVRKGVVKAPFTAGDFDTWSSSLPSNGGFLPADGHVPEVDSESPGFHDCISNPSK